MRRGSSLIALLALAVALPAAAGSPTQAPSPDARYREAVLGAYETWRERPARSARDEAACVRAWQDGDRVRDTLRALTPPERLAAYHRAVLACIDATLKVADECVLRPRGGPMWMTYFTTAQRKCAAVGRTVPRSDRDLPRAW